MTDLHDTEMTGTISTARHQVVRYRAGHESGDLFEEGQDFDGLTLTIEVADAADAQAMLDAISSRAAPAATDEALAAQIADQIVPEYRAKGAAYSCSSHTAKRWSAAYDAALLAQRAALSQPAPAAQPADDLRAAAVKAAVAEYGSKPSLDDGADILGRRCAVRGMMVRLMPHARRIEVFSRQRRPGWSNWGNEAEKFEEAN